MACTKIRGKDIALACIISVNRSCPEAESGNANAVRFACFFKIFRVASEFAVWNYREKVNENCNNCSANYLFDVQDVHVEFQKCFQRHTTLLEL